MRIGLLLFQAALRLYPSRFRDRFGDEMAALFEDLCDEARRRRGRRGVAATALRSLLWAPHGIFCAWRDIRQERRAARFHRGRGVGMLSSLLWDLHASLRGLRRSPAFALMALGSLALGMSANATMLTLVRGLVWGELPVPEPGRLLRVFERDPRGPSNFSYPNFADLRDQSREVFAGVLAHDLATFGLRRGGQVDVIHGELVSSNYFEVLRLVPAAGRLFSGSDAEDPGSELVAVISHQLWRRRFGGDAGVVGSVVELSGQPTRIVGVAPASFNGTKLGLGMDVWLPVRHWARAQAWQPIEERRQNRWLNVVARLAPGKSLPEAQAALDTIAARLAEQYPDANRNTRFALTTEAAGNFGGHGAQLTGTIGGVALLAAALVMLVACGNVAALLLARGLARGREMAVRQAMGASRGQLLRHFLAESLLLAAAATVLGLLLARAASPLLLVALPPLPYRFAVPLAPNGDVLALMALGGLMTAALCGLMPALRASAESGAAALLPQSRAASSPSRLRPLVALSAMTLAFCCVTLVMSALFARSLQAAHSVQPGFETRSRATASLDVGLAGTGVTTPVRYYQALLEGLARVPGIRGAAVASNLPLTDRQSTLDVFDAARPAEPDDPGIEAWTASVSESYFEVLGQPLLAGRSFSLLDREGPPVAIASRALAARLWPDSHAVGRRLRLGRSQVEVVGVAADAKYVMVSEPPRPALYLPFWQDPTERAEIVVHGQDEDPALAARIGEVARDVDARVPVFGAKALDVHLAGSLWMFRLAAGLAAGLGLLAAGLSLAGLYGVMAYGAQQRRAEIGIRMALGATRRRIVAMLLARGVRLTAAGVMLGLLGALAVAHLARGVVVGVSPHDPVAFLLVGASVAVFALAACLAPALAAARTDPVRSLRAES